MFHWLCLCLCFLVFIYTSPVTAAGEDDHNQKSAQGGECKLPPYPRYGTYTVLNIPDAVPGQTYPGVVLNVTCQPGYLMDGMMDTVICFNGVWSKEMPKCTRYCKLLKHPSVEYRCLGADDERDTTECGILVPAGTIVKPYCRAPDYHYRGHLLNMRCIDGIWDYIAYCKSECGISTEVGYLRASEWRARRGELPWHASIYSKLSKPYEQVCAGSLITTTAIISAAHCFWNDTVKSLPPSDYAVAVGKLYPDWDNSIDAKEIQSSDVAEIKIPPSYQGSANNHLDDIAVVIVTTPFTYQKFIQPICLDFDVNFDNLQTSPTVWGKVAGWIPKAKIYRLPSAKLKVVSLPMLSTEECQAVSPTSYRALLTPDKKCAGFTNATFENLGGAGLVCPTLEDSYERHYLRGVVSFVPGSAEVGPTGTFIAFTQIIKHENFIKEFL